MFDSGCNQHAPSIMNLHNSSKTQVAKELVSTHTKFFVINTSLASTLVVLLHSDNSWFDRPNLSSLCLMTPAATCSHPQTEKCPTSLLQKYLLPGDCLWDVRKCIPMHPQQNVIFSIRQLSQVFKLHFLVALEFCLSIQSMTATLVTDTISSFMYRLSMYAEVVFSDFFHPEISWHLWWISFWRGGAFSPNPNLVRQYLLPWKITVCYGQSCSLMYTCG